MGDSDYASNPTPVPGTTLTKLFFTAIDRFGGAPAFGRITPSEEVQEFSYVEILARVQVVSAALDACGLERGDRVAILSENRLEWALTDFGCLCNGLVDVPVYPSLTAQHIAYILRDCRAKLVFVPDTSRMARVVEARAASGATFEIVVFDPPESLPEGVVGWEAFLARGADVAAGTGQKEFRARALQAKTDDVATILYTSGTTGDPKGVMLTHGNVGSNVEACHMALDVGHEDVTVSFLPLSHILQRMVDYLFFSAGCKIVHARSMLTAADDMRLARPTVAVAVPRFYEKVHAAVMEVGGPKRVVVRWAVAVADRVAGIRLAGGTPSGLLALQFALADRLVFSKVRAAVGGRIRFFVSGSAPLAPELNRFFYSIGMVILEGYGLTETSPVTNVNTAKDFRIGTVGKAVAGTEVRIAEDGEILIRGPQVMRGYYNRPEDTAEAVEADGWFHTGDVGELDADGFLRITDRKKDLIVTAGGKNVAPQPIENRVKANPLVEEVVIVGDRRKFVSALVVPAFPELETWARSEGITWTEHRDLLENDRVRRHLEDEVSKSFVGLASYETPKKVVFLESDFSIQDGSLTPTLKVKRKVVQERFRAVIDALYEEAEQTHGR
ncbi:MAG: long-chain fatty acid--CoA ligase [Gemmatimonadetes bacterium]|nr:long-chain fatty acid--CoA ligase [Gemmatimonadota bacterium]